MGSGADEAHFAFTAKWERQLTAERIPKPEYPLSAIYAINFVTLRNQVLH
jgi:hypothetical protein